MIKEQAKALIDSLPDDATWEDLMYTIYVRKSIETGLDDVKHGRVKLAEDIRQKYGLS